MEQNFQNKDHNPFPEDKEAPHARTGFFFLKDFYRRYHIQIDCLTFTFMILVTSITVLFSIYIILAKYS